MYSDVLAQLTRRRPFAERTSENYDIRTVALEAGDMETVVKSWTSNRMKHLVDRVRRQEPYLRASYAHLPAAAITDA